MARQQAGTPSRRPVLAAVLLIATGLVDTLSALADLGREPYVILTSEGLYHLYLGGWQWARLVTGCVMVASGALLFTGRRWSIWLATATAVAAIVIHLVMVFYYPIWAPIVIGLAVATLRLLWQHSRQATEPTQKPATS